MSEDTPSCEQLVDALEREDDESYFLFAVATLRGQLWSEASNPEVYTRRNLVKLLCTKILQHTDDAELVGKLGSMLQSLFQFRGSLRIVCSRCRMEIRGGETAVSCPGKLGLQFHPSCLTCQKCDKPITSFTLNDKKHPFCSTCVPAAASELTSATATTLPTAAEQTVTLPPTATKAEILAAAAAAPQAPFTTAFEAEIDSLLEACTRADKGGGDGSDLCDEVAAVVRAYTHNEPRARIVGCLKYVAQRLSGAVPLTKSGGGHGLEGVGVVLRAFAVGPTGPFVKAALRSLVSAGTTGPNADMVKEKYGALLSKIEARAEAATA